MNNYFNGLETHDYSAPPLITIKSRKGYQMNNMKWYQQGDVIIFPVAKLPKGSKPIPNHRNTLAEGEVTGHAHRVKGSINLFSTPQTEDVFMSAPKRVTITHEEHDNIEIPAGVWKVGRVQEYDHFAEEARKVRD